MFEEDSFELPAGVEYTISKHYKNWGYILYPAKYNGWLQLDEKERIWAHKIMKKKIIIVDDHILMVDANGNELGDQLLNKDELKHYAEDAGKSELEIAGITEAKEGLEFIATGVVILSEEAEDED